MPPVTQQGLAKALGELDALLRRYTNGEIVNVWRRITEQFNLVHLRLKLLSTELKEVQKQMRIPRDEIQEARTLIPDDSYLFEVVELAKNATKGTGALPAGCLMFSLTAKVVEPTGYAGALVWDNFTIGTVDDPEGKDPDTWINPKAVGAQRWNSLVKACKVASDDDDVICVEIENQRFVGTVTLTTDDGVKNPQYKGRQRNNITRYYPVGDKIIGAGSPTGATKASPPGRATAPPPSRRAAPPPPPPAEEAGDGVDTAPPGPAAPQRRTRPETKAKVETIECTFCNPHQPVVRATYKDHIEEHKRAMSGTVPEE